MQTTIPRVVDLIDVQTWTAEPGDYVVRGANRGDRARLARITRKNGNTFRSSWDNGFLRVTIWPGTL